MSQEEEEERKEGLERKHAEKVFGLDRNLTCKVGFHVRTHPSELRHCKKIYALRHVLPVLHNRLRCSRASSPTKLPLEILHAGLPSRSPSRASLPSPPLRCAKHEQATHDVSQPQTKINLLLHQIWHLAPLRSLLARGRTARYHASPIYSSPQYLLLRPLSGHVSPPARPPALALQHRSIFPTTGPPPAHQGFSWICLSCPIPAASRTISYSTLVLANTAPHIR